MLERGRENMRKKRPKYAGKETYRKKRPKYAKKGTYLYTKERGETWCSRGAGKITTVIGRGSVFFFVMGKASNDHGVKKKNEENHSKQFGFGDPWGNPRYPIYLGRRWPIYICFYKKKVYTFFYIKKSAEPLVLYTLGVVGQYIFFFIKKKYIPFSI